MTSEAQVARLQRAYEATSYRVCLPAGDALIRIGQPCLAVDAMLDESGVPEWAFISAANPGSVPCSAAENELRHDFLLKRLADIGCPYFEAWGEPDGLDWEPEASVLILGIALARAVELATGFGQKAFVSGRRGEPAILVWC